MIHFVIRKPDHSFFLHLRPSQQRRIENPSFFSDTVTYAKVGCHLIPFRVNKLQDSMFREKVNFHFSLEFHPLSNLI